MLCYRCEIRACFLEDNRYRPRFECGDIERSLHGCYMYRPCRPVVMRPRDGDNRPQYGPALIAARMQAVRLADVKPRAIRNGDESYLVYGGENE
jgi:hypothetical protein